MFCFFLAFAISALNDTEGSKSTGLPYWMQVVSFVMASSLAVMKGFEFFRRGALEVRLTRDSFFRLLDSGEALFVHAGLLAREGPVLIDKVEVKMSRLAKNRETEKKFTLDVTNHGEKIKGEGFLARHHFYGASPLQFVAAASTQRPVYMCFHAEYRERQRQAFLDFEQELIELRRTRDQGSDTKTQDFHGSIESIVKTQFEKMCGLIQLEAGEYELLLTIHFEKLGFPLGRRRCSAHSYGYFTVEDFALRAYKNQLRNALSSRASSIVEGTQLEVPFPEFQPIDFTEEKSRRARKSSH